MALVAPASKTVRNKNLIFLVMVAVFAVWFSLDGWYRYPKNNDDIVARMKIAAESYNGLNPQDLPLLEKWPSPPPGGWSFPQTGWGAASPELREKVSELAMAKNVEGGWKRPTDIALQRYLGLGLIVATFATLGWFFKVQRRRVLADETMLSPAPGITIPWSQITKIDNTQWKKKDIVTIEYRVDSDASGTTRSAVLDGYLMDDLVPILEMLADKADKAEVINPPSPPSTAAAEEAGKPN